MSRKLTDEGHMRTMSKFKEKRMDRSESERDSGFSDASSEHLSAVDQTDTDDTLCSVASAGAGSRSQPSQLAAVVGGGALQGLSPMIIMNNVVLKQSGDNPPSTAGLKLQGFKVVQQPQVVFLQPMVPQRTDAVSKGIPSKRRRDKKYLPILKSYPKIAPHPRDSPQKGGDSSSSTSSSGSSVKSLSSSQSDCSQKDHQHSSQPSASSITPTAATLPNSPPASALPHNTPADSDANGSLYGSGPASTRPKSTDSCPDLQTLMAKSRDASTSIVDSKLKRFCNTYNILSKSGLLDITLRTKELIRQNRRTQTELERLREHTKLYVAALQTGDSEIWSKLQMSMQEENRSRTQHHEDTQMIH